MMSIVANWFKRWTVGLDLANNSLKKIWKHKKLLIYPVISWIPLIVTTVLVFFNKNANLDAVKASVEKFKESYGATSFDLFLKWFVNNALSAHYIIYLLYFASSLLIVFSFALFVKHVHSINNQQAFNVSESIRSMLQKWMPLVSVALLLTLIEWLRFIYHASLFVSIGMLLWKAFFILLIPLCVLYRLPFIQNFVATARLAFGRIPEFIGGWFWLFLVEFFLDFIVLLPTAIVSVLMLNQEGSPGAFTLFLWLAATVMFIAMQLYFLTVYWGFGVLMVEKFKKEHE